MPDDWPSQIARTPTHRHKPGGELGDIALSDLVEWQRLDLLQQIDEYKHTLGFHPVDSLESVSHLALRRKLFMKSAFTQVATSSMTLGLRA